MKLKFATATAISLMLIAAPLANDNMALLVQGYSTSVSNDNTGLIDQAAGSNNIAKATQLGNRNVLTIDQEGSANWAGTHLQKSGLDPWDNASNYNYMTQSGNNNVLTLVQTGRANIVAVGGNFWQSGNFNTATITQNGKSSSSNRVNNVSQVDSTGAATAATNSLTVTQTGAAAGAYPGVHPTDYNYSPNVVGSVSQTWTGAVANPNTLTITQTGAVHSRPNTVTSAVQNGGGNNATITQEGHSNTVALLSQTGTGNKATVTLEGNLNGSAGFSSATVSLVGLTQGQVVQNGIGNNLSYDVLGSSNLYSFKQENDNNDIRVDVIGDGNQVAVSQAGNGNHVFTQQMGGNNSAGIIQ